MTTNLISPVNHRAVNLQDKIRQTYNILVGQPVLHLYYFNRLCQKIGQASAPPATKVSKYFGNGNWFGEHTRGRQCPACLATGIFSRNETSLKLCVCVCQWLVFPLTHTTSPVGRNGFLLFCPPWSLFSCHVHFFVLSIFVVDMQPLLLPSLVCSPAGAPAHMRLLWVLL